MERATFTKSAAGRLVRTAEGASAFVPSPLPPDLKLSWELTNALTAAERALGFLILHGENRRQRKGLGGLGEEEVLSHRTTYRL